MINDIAGQTNHRALTLPPRRLATGVEEDADCLRDTLLPEVPYRQWVLTVPWALRARRSVDRPLLSDVLSTFLRTVFAWQRRRGRSVGTRDVETGAVTFLQRFGGVLNVYPNARSRRSAVMRPGVALTVDP